MLSYAFIPSAAARNDRDLHGRFFVFFPFELTNMGSYFGSSIRPAASR
jgi:hypothetical protein